MSALDRKEVPFHKLHGCGNDFIVIDNHKMRVDRVHMPSWAMTLCRRAFGIGADGLFFLDTPSRRDDVDYEWDFYNPDGSRAEMCGNGARCAAWIAVELGLAPPEHTIGTDAGPVRARVNERAGTAKVRLTEPEGLSLDKPVTVDGWNIITHFVNTGVPHAVVTVNDLATAEVLRVGSALRYHDHFQPSGTNVNFIQIETSERFRIRTYERGVETETNACGTGACASLVGLVEDAADAVTVGGDVLRVSLEDGRLYLEGPVRRVFTGSFNPEEMGLTIR